MSCIDYSQTATDHQCLLVLVQHTGTRLQLKTFNRVWERIKRVQHLQIQGQRRSVWLRYKRGYPVDNNEWGDFQAHRKVLGLLSVGQCTNGEEFEELFNNYKTVKEKYASSIYNSRLLTFGLNKDGSPLDSEPVTIFPESGDHAMNDGRSGNISKVSDQNSNLEIDTCAIKTVNAEEEKENSKDLVNSTISCDTGKKRPHSNSLTKESTGSEVVFYPSFEQCDDLEERLKEFVTSLFFVLEGKRLDRSYDRADKLHLLCAPFEKKDYVGIDTDTRSYKRKCQGRLRKHLADLCLQAGLPGEAMLHYQTANDILKAANDWLWIGACYEGLCSASVILTYPKTESPSVRRNLSFSIKRGISLNEAKIRAGPLNQSYANGFDNIEATARGCLNPEDIIDKYKEAIIQYSKYKGAGVIEMEASIKACRVLILQKKFLQASDFLGNVVFISLQSSDEDKISRYSTLAGLYGQIGFHRKAAFFKRVAAMQCVSPQSPRNSWYHCYNLLLQALEGYSIGHDPREFLAEYNCGWPVIQMRILHELVYAARRMGNPQLAVRHMTFLLHTMHTHLSPQERGEMARGLETHTLQCEGTPQPLALESGLILPPVPMTNLPTVLSFKLLNLAPHLRPNVIKITPCVTPVKNPNNPFIFTPLSLGLEPEVDETKTTSVDFKWVAGDLCEVNLQVTNPMPGELKVTHMGLLTEGLDIEVYPATPTLRPDSGPSLVKIMAIPKSAGELTVLGYVSHVLGVRSHCRLRDLSRIPGSHITVTVVPPLPQLQLTASLPKAATFSDSGNGANVVASATTLLYGGQRQECMVTLRNIGNLAIEMLEITMNEKDLATDVFHWSSENVQSQLPIQPDSIACFTLLIDGTTDFLGTELSVHDMYIADKVSVPLCNTSTRYDSIDTKTLDSILRIRYSGGLGLEAGYCRRCALSLSVDIVPSLLIRRWAVKSAISTRQCYLELDIMNAANHQLTVCYSQDQSVILGVNQMCRHGSSSRSKSRRAGRSHDQNNEEREQGRIALLINRQEFSPLRDSCETESESSRKLNSFQTFGQQLAQIVDIRWKLEALNLTGTVSVQHLEWTTEQLELLRLPLIQWDVLLNDHEYVLGEVFESGPGEVVEVSVNLKNESGFACDGFEICVRCYSNQENGDKDWIGDGKWSCLGADRIPSKLSDDICYSCSFLFYCCGDYRLDIRGIVTKATGDASQSEPVVWKYYPIVTICVLER